MATVASLINIADLGAHSQPTASGRKKSGDPYLGDRIGAFLAAKFRANPLWWAVA